MSSTTSDTVDRAAFLATVIADPDDDAPRLIFADWLDEHGEADRAELIRVQCALAELPPQAGDGPFVRLSDGRIGIEVDEPDHPLYDGPVVMVRGVFRLAKAPGCEFGEGDPAYWDRHVGGVTSAPRHDDALYCGRAAASAPADGAEVDLDLNAPRPSAETAPHCPCSPCSLRRRERELLKEAGLRDWHLHDLGGLSCRRQNGEPVWDDWEYRRGFVEAVTCTAADWLAHADAILAAQPVREVTLTTLPKWAFTPNIQENAPLSFTCQARVTVREGELPQFRSNVLLPLLAAEWPGITFTLSDSATAWEG